MKTFGGKVVGHSLAYLTVHKLLVGDVSFYLEFLVKVTHPLQKQQLPIDVNVNVNELFLSPRESCNIVSMAAPGVLSSAVYKK